MKTQNAIDEGIVEARWYCQEELNEEVVYPSILVSTDWRMFLEDSWEVKYLESKVADADL